MSYYKAQQPMPTQGMQVAAGGNRNAMNKPYDSDGKREWSNGLCGCFEACGTFCYAWWCPCIVHGKNKQRLRHLAEQGSPHPEGGSCCNGSCWGHCCLTSFTGLGFILQAINRGETRSRPCDLTQVSREIELEEQSFGQRY
ncbi:hypothetical protein B0H10DRAFT_2220671 [Mycena sp. CBHHK59/15]|nr:hypothetical protein B0H10DRAFT_2220671 [Mycena sp. CBHHK59/15]